MSQRVMITFNHAGPDNVLVHCAIIVRVELLVQFLHRSMKAYLIRFFFFSDQILSIIKTSFSYRCIKDNILLRHLQYLIEENN